VVFTLTPFKSWVNFWRIRKNAVTLSQIFTLSVAAAVTYRAKLQIDTKKRSLNLNKNGFYQAQPNQQ